MNQQNNWDWDIGENRIPLAGWKDAYIWVEELQAGVDGEIEKFAIGIYTVALDGRAWDQNFVNVWKIVFSPNMRSLAAEVRLNRLDHTTAVDGIPIS
jgi:hypothetical protein